MKPNPRVREERERAELQLETAKRKIESDDLFGFIRAKAIMGIPPLYDNIRFDSSHTMATIKRAVDQRRSIFLNGSPGTGKTHYAVLSAWYWCRKHLEPKIYVTEVGNFVVDMKNYSERETIVNMPKFLSVCDLFLEIKDTFYSRQTEADIIAKYATVPFLILDDIGQDKPSEYNRSLLYALIDKRYRYNLQTVFTSNNSLEELARVLDDRIASRVIGMCGIENLITLSGDDRRIQ